MVGRKPESVLAFTGVLDDVGVADLCCLDDEVGVVERAALVIMFPVPVHTVRTGVMACVFHSTLLRASCELDSVGMTTVSRSTRGLSLTTELRGFCSKNVSAPSARICRARISTACDSPLGRNVCS